MRALVTFTVAESKKLIAKSVVRHPIVVRALADHTVILEAGTTNAFVYTEITGKPLDPGSFATGIVCPDGPCSSGRLQNKKPTGAVIFIKGVEQENKAIEDVVNRLGAEDVFIKGANAIDPEGRAGVIVAHPQLGHAGVGELWTRTVTQGISVVMPVGLEKRIPCSIYEASSKVGVKTVQYSTGLHFGLFIPHGNVTVLTEIEAIRELTGADATVVAAGGVNGAEGALIFSIEGSKAQINKMIQLVDEVKGVPPITTPRGVCISTPGYTFCLPAHCFWKGVPNSKRPAWKQRKELEIHDRKPGKKK